MNKRFEDMLGDSAKKNSSMKMQKPSEDDSDATTPTVELPPLTSEALRKASSAMAPEMEVYDHVYTPHQLPFALAQLTDCISDKPRLGEHVPFETQMVPVDPSTINMQ